MSFDMPRYHIIAALALNGVIGRAGKLPWRQKADLERFKRKTQHQVVIMGRATQETLPDGYLADRLNIVLSRTPRRDALVPDTFFEPSLPRALYLAQQLMPQAQVFVIGGAEVFRQALPGAATLHLTWIHAHLTGDTWFPSLNLAEWHPVSMLSAPADDSNTYDYSCCTYVRKACIF